MTTWVEEPSGGRARGPRGIVRAWFEVLVRPGRFFRHGIAPGDQAPGLAFAMAVVAIEESSRFLLVEGALPEITGSRAASLAIALGVATFLITPAALHLISGLQTLVLMAVVDERAGVSETVQVVAYSIAPCALAGPAIPELRIVCCAYGSVVFLVGLREVHGLSTGRTFVAGIVPAAIVFGYAFRGFAASTTLLARWGIEVGNLV